MGDGGQNKSPRKTEASIPQLEDKLWKAVQAGKVKNLQIFIDDYKEHDKFNQVLNGNDPEYDEDGGHVVIYCTKEGRDKGPSFGGRDYGSCLSLLVESGADVNKTDMAQKTALSWAVSLKYPNFTSRLLKLGADVSIYDQDGNSPLHIAIYRGYKDIVASILEVNPKVANLRDNQGVPALVTAVKYKHLEICRLLLDHGADVNAAEQKNKRTAVYHAIRNKHLEILDILLKHKPHLDTVDSEGRSILYLCCESTDVRFFHKVISQCPKFSKKIMDQTGDDDKTPVIVACQHGNAEQLKHLLDNGASVKASDTSGKTALHHCADNLETQCAEMLLEKDSAILEVQDEQGYTALALAVLVGNVNLIKLLLEKGADIGTDDNEGHKLAHWAAVCGHLKVLDILIQNKADMSTADSHHAYPIHYAAQMNGANSGNTESRISEKVLKKFLDSKVRLDVVDDAGRQPLLWAACSGNAESCKMLLKAGADINSTDKDDLTALHCAASRGHYDCIEVLRKNGADVNLIDKNKCTPLFYAITLGNKDCTHALIKAKTNVNHVDDRGRNPAHCAAIKGCLDTVKLLEKEKADLWHQNNKGDYPIHEAAQKGHIDVVKYLMQHKNDKDAVNVTNKVGKTLLHIAAATNNLPLCKLLINADCNKNALMKHAGKEFTPYDLAVIKGYKDAADYLKQKGALPYSDLSNIEKRQSKSARSRKSNIEPVKEESEKKEKGKKSPTKDKATPTKEAGKVSPAKEKGSQEAKPHPESPVKAVVVTAVTAEEKKEKGKEEEKQAKSVSPSKTPSPVKGKESPVKSEGKESPKVSEGKESPKVSDGKESPKKSESPQLDKSVGIDKDTSGVNTDAEKRQKKVISKKPSADSVLEKEDGIRTSNVSLRSEESPLTRDAGTQKQGPRLRDGSTSPMGQSQGKKKEKEKETGKYVSLERIEPTKTEDEADSPEGRRTRGTGRKTPRSRVGFNDNDDSGNETDPSRSKSRQTTRRSKKPYIDHVRESVRKYQNKRNYSRSLNQLKRAQVHTGPMHDIVMFSKMMDNYRRGLMGDEEDLDLRNYANWDGYLNEQLRFVSHLYNDDGSETPRDVQDMAKEQYKMLETEANNRKKDTDNRCGKMAEQEEFQRKKNMDMDKEIDSLATRTAEMFDSVKTGASTSLASAKSRNTKLRDEMRKSREEKLLNTTDPHEREILQRQALEDQLEDQQHELDTERKERYKSWNRRKDEDMRRKLLQAYRPYFPNDVFSKKSVAKHGRLKPLKVTPRPKTQTGTKVCISGGRVKSAGRLRVESSPSPRPRRPFQSPRPSSTKSGTTESNYSSAQYRLKEDKTHVQMTPYGLRRVRNQERPTYDRRARVYVFKSEFEIQNPKYGYDPEQILKTIRELESKIRRKYPATYESCICGATRLRRFVTGREGRQTANLVGRPPASY
ncbi:ankycorbin-like isoform X5 [Mercenaria mercenaria]|uniref:ankycorbin-like isoform X5 n=1 Tax=Mercenaria mercenaria TaxID=6596 RepID=UPI00234E5282|nr:ankycorbin-like isoform X5 [Mercenaria mercenaria]